MLFQRARFLIRIKLALPSRHRTLIQRRLNVDATSWRCVDVEPTLFKHHVPAGYSFTEPACWLLKEWSPVSALGMFVCRRLLLIAPWSSTMRWLLQGIFVKTDWDKSTIRKKDHIVILYCSSVMQDIGIWLIALVVTKVLVVKSKCTRLKS